MRFQRLAVLPVATAALALPLMFVTPANAASTAQRPPAASATTKPTTVAKPTKDAKPAKAVKPAKPVKPVKPTTKPKAVKVSFTATGSITAVDAAAGTVTVAVKGGTKELHRTTITVGVATDARVKLDDATVTLASLAAGQHVAITGTRVDTVFTAAKVNASTLDAPILPAVPTAGS
jgi:hypothetical protein